MRGLSRGHRPLIAFRAPDVSIVLNGLIWGVDQAQQVYRSPALSTDGHTHVEAYVTLDIITDSAPGGDFALLVYLVQACGSAGCRGARQAIGFGIPGLPFWNKGYPGPGPYTLFLSTGGSGSGQRLDPTPSLALGAAVEIWATGGPAGREFHVALDGAIVAGDVR